MGLFDSIKKFVDNIFGAIGDVLGYVLGIDTDLEDKYKGQLINKSSNIQKIPVIYGERLVGGTRVFVSTGGGKKNQYLYIALVLSEGEVDSIGDIYINDIISTDSRFTNKATIYKYRGTDNQAATTLFADADESWTSAHQLKGVAYLAMRFKYDQDVFTSIPEIRAVVKGKKVYNPATQITEWSDNPALCLRDYLTNPRYGKGLPASAIDDASIIQAASDCDSLVTPYGGATDIPLFKFNAIIDTGETVFDNVKKIIASMRGILPYSNGKYSLLVDKDQSSTFTLTEDNILSDIKIVSSSKENKFNQVTAKFPNPAKRWELDTVTYPDSGSTEETAFLNEDNQQILSKEITLHNVTNAYRAKDLARIACLASRRQSLTVSVTCTSEALNIAVGDIVTIEHDSLGWTGAAVQEFRVMGMVLDDSGEVDLTLQQYDASIYPWVEQSEIPDNPETTLPDPFTTAPVTNQSGTGQAVVQNDGTVTYFYDLEWDEPDDALVEYYLIDVNKTINEVETLAAETLQTQNLSFRYMVSDTSIDYGFTIRAVNGAGTRSAGVTIPASSVIKDTTPPSVIDAQTTSVVAGLQSITVSWENPTEEDFDLVRIKVNDTNTEPTSHFAATRSDTFIHDIGEYSTIKYYWIAPVDTSGNVADYTFAGSATTGSIDYGDVLNPPTIPEVATTVYLTLGDNNAPTDTEFSTAVGRDPIENDSAIINKEYAFTYNGTAWTAVTEFIDGSLLVTDSVTASEINVTNLSSLSSDLGAVTAGSIDINSGVFTVNSSGDMTASSAVIDGNVTAQSLDVENATVTGTFIAPIGWSDGVYNGVINRGNLNESVKDLIDERIAEVTGGISGDFGQDDGSFSYIAQGNPDPDNPIVLNITHENGKDLTVELSGSRSWNRQFIGLPDTDMGVTIILERSPAGADTWTTLETLTDSGSSITTSGPTLIHSSTYAYSISIYHVLTDDQASGNYDYRARTTVAGSAYSVGVPIQLTVVEPATVGAGNADTLDNQDGTYYLDYNNFTNTPSTTNWDTAYGWGNHASAGYLTTHQDISGKANLSGASFTGVVSTELGENDGFRIGSSKLREIGASLIFNSDGIRFGTNNANWDYDEWAGLKYYHPSKTIYFGGARASTSYWENNLGDANDTKIDFVGVTDLKHNGTTVIDSSRNIKNIGTVSSGVMYPKTTNGSAVGGGIFLAPEYNGTNPLTSDHIPVMSTSYSSGGLIIGYGAAGKAGSGSNTFTSTFDNFSGRRSAVKFLDAQVTFWGTTSATQTAVGSDLAMQEGLVINTSTGTIDVKHGGYQIGGTTVIDSSRNLTNIQDVTISGNGNEINFTGGNNRIKFSGYRALEGSTDGSNLQLGEQYAQVSVVNTSLFVNKRSGDHHFGIIGPNTAYQRVDGRDESTLSRAHWYGITDTGATSNFRHAWYDGNSYVDVTAENDGVTFGGSLNPTSYKVSGTTVINSSRVLTNIVGLQVSGTYVINSSGSLGVRNSSGSTGLGLSLYGGSSTGQPTYGLMFAGTSTFGTYGGVSGSWATYFTMNNDTSRGWIFKRGTVNVASIDGGGDATFNGDLSARSFEVSGTTVINSSRNMYPNVIDMGSGHAQGYKFHGRSYSWNSAMQSPTTKMPHIWQENYSGWDPILGIKTTNGFWQMGAYSSNKIHFGYMAGAYGGHSSNSFDTSWAFTPSTFIVGDVGTMNLTASGNITAYSDARLKDNVKTLDGSKVYQMRGVSFTKDGELGSGVIAQELEKVAPELVLTNDDEMQTKSVAYGNVVGYLIEAIKELKSEIEELKNANSN